MGNKSTMWLPGAGAPGAGHQPGAGRRLAGAAGMGQQAPGTEAL